MVILVGAGPGDPGLITMRGVECLRLAQVVVYDRLAGRRLLRYAPQAEMIDVGKSPDHHPVPQAEINRILIEKASAGKLVVRLKGGDPFVFGRGGEEALALVEAGIPFEIVPGVTSAVAVPAYAGIPVTQRNLVTSFAIMTGHRAEESRRLRPKVDCSDVHADTRVFLMGVHNLDAIVKGLSDNGCPGDTPAAVISQGTTPQQAVVVGALADIVEKAAAIEPPAIIIVGEVVRLREQMRWFDHPARRPLLGLRILNTRPEESGGLDELTAALAGLGAEVIEQPAFRLVPPPDPEPLDAAIRRLAGGGYDWILFSSANAVRFFFARLEAAGFDTRILAGVKIGATGSATGEALAGYHLKADFIPSRFSGADWAVEAGDLAGRRVLLPRSEAGMAGTVQALVERGAEVDAVTAYAPVPAEPEPEALAALLAGSVDLAVLFSPSAVRGLLEMLEQAAGPERMADLKRGLQTACIGPTTAAAAAGAGLQVAVVPKTYTVEGLVEALKQWRTAQAGR
jgi:uroporphyrinogen III methyltransferase/synthase